MAKRKTKQEKLVKEQAIQQFIASEEYLLVSIAPKNKFGFQDTDLHISNTAMIGEALRNLARSNPVFRDMMLDAVFLL